MLDQNAPDPAPNPGDPPPVVPLAVVDQLLADVAAALHDRPVQSLVAAKLMIESVGGAAAVAEDPLYVRGLKALTDAGQLSRDVMWALTHMEPQHDHLEDSVRDLFERVGPESGLEVGLSGVAEADPTAVALLLDAAHDVAGGLALRGGTLELITVDHDEGVTSCALATTGAEPTDPDPWLELATRRLAAHGGTVTRRQRGPVTRTVLRLG